MYLYGIKNGITIDSNIQFDANNLYYSIEEAIDSLEDKKLMLGNHNYSYIFLTIYKYEIISGEGRVLIDTNVIRINKLWLEKYNMFTGEQSGLVRELIYENRIEKEDRVLRATFITKDIFKEFKHVALSSGILINNIDETNDFVYYKDSIESNRKRNIFKVDFTIPSNIDALNIWRVLDNNTKNLNSKRVSPSSL